MDEECCSGDGEKRCPMWDVLKEFGSDLRDSDVTDHVRGVQREALLAVRSLLDVCIKQLEPRDRQEPERGRNIPVE